MEAYTIESWLRGKIDFNFTEESINAALFDRGVAQGSYVSEVTTRQRELCYADLLMYAASSSSSTTGEYVSDGGWQHQKSNKNVVDRASMKETASKIYAKWNDTASALTSSGRVTLKNLY
ncbi:MAG: hypothetical protein WCS15_01315 [Prevotella sp.]